MWGWEGCQAVFNPVGQRVFPGCLEGVRVWRKGKGWSGLRPLVLIKVRRCKSIKKTFASNQTPFSVVPVPFSIPVSLVLSVPLLEIIIMPIFIVKQVPVPPAALPGPAR